MNTGKIKFIEGNNYTIDSECSDYSDIENNNNNEDSNINSEED